ncbi:MAG: sulfotransferase [Pseudomonadota bacterium]
MRNYVVIVGHGRSGSNRLLDTLDCHEATFCRNEPNELQGAVMAALEDGFFEDRLSPDFQRHWRASIARAAARCSGKDRFDACRKVYHAFPYSDRVGAYIFKRRRLRLALGLVVRDMKKEEWETAAFHIDQAALRRATPVFKILLNPGWLTRTHEDDENQRVIHNIRNPVAFLKSWRNRYVTPTGPEKVYRDNLETLDLVLAAFGRPRWSVPAFSEEALFETELWRWRYVNEALYSALNGSPRYMVTRYEDYDDDPKAIARAVYAFAGLQFEQKHAERISEMENTLFGDAPRPAEIKIDMEPILERVLADSPLLDLMSSTVSGSQ